MPQYLKNVKPAVLTVSGWFDAEDMYGALSTFRAVEADKHAPFNGLVMGPWFHGGWEASDGESLGAVSFGSKTAEFYRKEIEFPFFQHFLKGVSGELPPKAYMFETGTNRWEKFDAWPPKAAHPSNIYLAHEGILQFDQAARRTIGWLRRIYERSSASRAIGRIYRKHDDARIHGG